MGVTASPTSTVAPALTGTAAGQGRSALHAWWMYLLAIALLTCGYALAHFSGPGWMKGGLVFNLIGGSSVAALIVGARRNSGRSRLPWYLLAVGQGLFVTSDVLAYNYERLFGAVLPFPSVADPFHLAFYPFLVAGMLLLVRERGENRDRAALIDALIVTLALATLLWVYLIAPYADDHALSLLGRLTSMAYPSMDILVLGVVARVAAGSHRCCSATRSTDRGCWAAAIRRTASWTPAGRSTTRCSAPPPCIRPCACCPRPAPNPTVT
jgi:hypothetical protein